MHFIEKFGCSWTLDRLECNLLAQLNHTQY
jgi:hypothetical protein